MLKSLNASGPDRHFGERDPNLPTGSRLEQRARAEFDRLTRDEVATAIRRMASEGMSDYGVASACRLSVEQIRAILAERRESGQ